MKKFNINTVFLYVAIFLALIGPLSNILPLGPLKNLRFLSAVLVLPFFTFRSGIEKKNTLKFYKSLFIIYILVIFYTVLLAFLYFDYGLTYRNIVNIILTLIPLIFSWGIVKYCNLEQLKSVIVFLFYAFALLYFGELLKGGVSLGALKQIFQSNIATESNYDTESGISLLMGFFYLFFLSQKRYRMAGFAALLTLLGAKRIAIFSVFLCTLLYYFYPFRGVLKQKKINALIFLTVGIIVAIFWDGIITGSFDTIIQEYTGISANRFFMGRLGRFALVFSEIDSVPIPGLGYGLGYMENILYYTIDQGDAFHGDFYRLYLEFGVILFGIWIYTIGKYSTTGKLALTSSILLILLMQTDNAFLYNRVMFSYYLILSYTHIYEQQRE